MCLPNEMWPCLDSVCHTLVQGRRHKKDPRGQRREVRHIREPVRGLGGPAPWGYCYSPAKPGGAEEDVWRT